MNETPLQLANRMLRQAAPGFAAARWRPRYHFSAPLGWMNDPHPPVWYKGEYHIFYNHFPFEAVGIRPKSWGHITTRDFTSYTVHPFAIAPDTPADADGCASGAAVLHGQGMALVYTGRAYYRQPREVQCVAFSDDGMRFAKAAQNPVLVPDDLANPDFRDPYVWREDGGYHMLLGGRNGAAQVLHYTSADLLRWQPQGVLCRAAPGQGSMWECPCLAEVGGRPYLMVSPMNIDGEIQKTIYLAGQLARLPGEGGMPALRFAPAFRQDVDHGCDFYAGQFWRTAEGAPMLLGWMGKWENPMPCKRHGWAGVLALPKEVHPGPGGTLRWAFPQWLQRLRGKGFERQAPPAAPGQNLLAGFRAASFSLQFTLPRAGGAVSLGLFCGAGGPALSFVFDRQEGSLRVENNTVRCTGATRCIPLPAGETLAVELYADVSCAELLVNGEVAVTHRVYPAEGDDGLLLAAEGAPPAGLCFYEMQPADIRFEV